MMLPNKSHGSKEFSETKCTLNNQAKQTPHEIVFVQPCCYLTLIKDIVSYCFQCELTLLPECLIRADLSDYKSLKQQLTMTIPPVLVASPRICKRQGLTLWFCQNCPAASSQLYFPIDQTLVDVAKRLTVLPKPVITNCPRRFNCRSDVVIGRCKNLVFDIRTPDN